MRIKRTFSFDAAHRLPGHPGKCRDLHGHRYGLAVTVDRPVDRETGLVIDFKELKEIVAEEVLDRLDHKYVNDVIDNPTAELMAVWIWDRLLEKLPGLAEIELHETESCSVIYRGERK
jgi:6-pyruvoyltetrahydropterin/6-carboxytetrahydropterin synthase